MSAAFSHPPMINSSPQAWWHVLPVVNASLNGAAAVLLIAAFVMVKQRRYTAHAALMIGALAMSSIFLTCYVIYHRLKFLNGETITRFPPGPWRGVYLAILFSHTTLAILILPLIYLSVYFAWAKRWRAHHRVSVVTFPLWTYVSITGVVVYWMLYHLAPTLR